ESLRAVLLFLRQALGSWNRVHSVPAVGAALFGLLQRPRKAEPQRPDYVLADLWNSSHGGRTGFLFVWPAGFPVVRVATQLGLGTIAALWAVYRRRFCRSLCGRVFAGGLGIVGTGALGEDASDCAQHFRHAAVSDWDGAR